MKVPLEKRHLGKLEVYVEWDVLGVQKVSSGLSRLPVAGAGQGSHLYVEAPQLLMQREVKLAGSGRARQ
jgi:hypothetical protein